MSMRSMDPSRRRVSRGEEQPPWWGGFAPEASDDLYLLQPIVQWKMLFLHSVEQSTLCNKLAGTSM